MPIQPEAPIEIVPYGLAWPTLFEGERALLLVAFQPWLCGPIEHIGSTAVPGMPAKPVIDIMAAVESLAGSLSARTELQRLEYQYAPYRSDVMHWFCKPGFSKRTHHLHLVPYRSQLWKERLRFRDCLRSVPEVAKQYAALKYRLAALHRADREAYTEAKGPFIAQVLREHGDDAVI